MIWLQKCCPCSLKSMGKKLQNDLWACAVASKLSERRPPSLFLGADTKNGFLSFCQLLLRFWCCNLYTWYYHAEPLILTIPKEYWFSINSILSGLNREEKRVFCWKKDPITVGWHKKNPKLMRSNSDMTTTPHRTCVGKERKGKGTMTW